MGTASSGQVSPNDCDVSLLWLIRKWTKASSDDTVQVVTVNPTSEADKVPRFMTHPTAVRCLLPIALTDLAEPYLITGSADVIRAYDVSSIEEPEILSEIDAHWHDVTALRLWMRKFTGADGYTRIEPWVLSASLDGTLRKWKLSGMCDLLPCRILE